MRTTAFIIIGIFLAVLLPGAASAITITPSSSTVQVGQPATLNAQVVFNTLGVHTCNVTATFGDGASQVFLVGTGAPGCVSNPLAGTITCTQVLTHAYTVPGSYPVQAGSAGGGCLTSPIAPDPANATVIVSSPITVTPVPSTLNVTWGVPAGRNITYKFVGGGNTTLQSQGGRFVANGQEIGTVNVPLNVTIKNGQGSVPEFLNIPVDLIAKAAKMKVSQFEYRRGFSGAPGSVEAVVKIFVTSEAVGDFNINRMELYFENRRPEITIDRNTQKLKAFVDLRFTGSGLLEGYWKVDGRVLSQVKQHLTYGRSVTLEIPEIPGLPTFDEGTHAVRFIITRPATDFQFPTIIYYVTAKTVRIGPPVRLVRPAEGYGAGPGPIAFSWDKPEGASVFLISFYEKPDENPIYSALTKETGYTLPEGVIKMNFKPDHQYFWRVAAFNAENNQTGESEKRTFILK